MFDNLVIYGNDQGHFEFEGEYINGKRNGKGKIFSFGKLVFEGEYLSGEKSGKCKEYYFNDNSKLRYEGEYLNGKKWNIKSYDPINSSFSELKDGKGYLKEYTNYDNMDYQSIDVVYLIFLMGDWIWQRINKKFL